jgi:hypothetical protein
MADIVSRAMEIFNTHLEPLSLLCDELQSRLDHYNSTENPDERDRCWSAAELAHKDVMARWQDSFGLARMAVDDFLECETSAAEHIARSIRENCCPSLKMALAVTRFEQERNLRLDPDNPHTFYSNLR